MLQVADGALNEVDDILKRFKELTVKASADTAYNSDDRAESYYVNGQKVNKFMLYTDNQDYKNNAPNYTTDRSNFDTSAGFSIINTQSALPFTENIKFTGKQPDSFGFIEYNGGKCGDLQIMSIALIAYFLMQLPIIRI